MNFTRVLFLSLCLTTAITNAQISWNYDSGTKLTWSMHCDFYGNDLTSKLTKGQDCGLTCRNTPGCTHFTWTNHDGGRCFMKQGTNSKDNAIVVFDAVCGIIDGADTGATASGIQRGPLLWSDEFNYQASAPRPDYWIQETGGHGWGNNELQYYSTQNAQVNNGQLVITSKKEWSNGKQYTSSRLISTRKFRYGIIEYRAKLPKGRGSWPAFWLLAAKRPLNWPGDGEIDVMEHVGYDPNIVHATIHTSKYNHMIGTQKFNKMYVNNVFDDYHLYSLDWNADRLKFYIDEKLLFTYTKEAGAGKDSWPFDDEFNIIINTAIGGDWGGAQGLDDSIFPCYHVVDYVRHYASKN